MTTKVNYDDLRREYRTTNISIRKLADKHGLGWSTVAERARNEGWKEERLKHRAKVNDKVAERDVAKYVRDIEELEYEQIQAARAIIFAGLEAIRNKEVTVQPRDMTLAIDKLQLLTGKATERTEATVVGESTAVLGPDPEFLRRLEELSRGALDDAPRFARLRIEGPKPN